MTITITGILAVTFFMLMIATGYISTLSRYHMEQFRRFGRLTDFTKGKEYEYTSNYTFTAGLVCIFLAGVSLMFV